MRNIAHHLRPQGSERFPAHPGLRPAALGIGHKRGHAAQAISPAHQQRFFSIHAQDSFRAVFRFRLHKSAQARRLCEINAIGKFHRTHADRAHGAFLNGQVFGGFNFGVDDLRNRFGIFHKMGFPVRLVRQFIEQFAIDVIAHADGGDGDVLGERSRARASENLPACRESIRRRSAG